MLAAAQRRLSDICIYILRFPSYRESNWFGQRREEEDEEGQSYPRCFHMKYFMFRHYTNEYKHTSNPNFRSNAFSNLLYPYITRYSRCLLEVDHFDNRECIRLNFINSGIKTVRFGLFFCSVSVAFVCHYSAVVVIWAHVGWPSTRHYTEKKPILFRYMHNKRGMQKQFHPRSKQNTHTHNWKSIFSHLIIIKKQNVCCFCLWLLYVFYCDTKTKKCEA